MFWVCDPSICSPIAPCSSCFVLFGTMRDRRVNKLWTIPKSWRNTDYHFFNERKPSSLLKKSFARRRLTCPTYMYVYSIMEVPMGSHDLRSRVPEFYVVYPQEMWLTMANTKCRSEDIRCLILKVYSPFCFFICCASTVRTRPHINEVAQ